MDEPLEPEGLILSDPAWSAACEAAAAEGETPDRWIERAVLASATRSLRRETPGIASERHAESPSAPPVVQARMDPALEGTLADLHDALDALALRMDSYERRLELRMTAIEDNLERVMRQRPAAADPAPPPPPSDPISLVPVQRAIRHLSEQISGLEESLRPAPRPGFFARLIGRKG